MELIKGQNFYVNCITEVYVINDMINTCAQASRLSHASHCDRGPKDIALLSKLVKAGDEHAKALRGVTIIVEIDAPRYFWTEFVTYRPGCEQLGSESTMHGQVWRFNDQVKSFPEKTGDLLSDKANLPEGLMQTRIFAINYQALRHMYKQRRHHRLREWQWFCDWIDILPFAAELITIGVQ